MKKLIIAAGIAAATMASFGASAENYTSSASVNTIVTGGTGFSVSADGGSVNVDQFKTAGTLLGTFKVTAPTGAAKFSLSDIHAHNYPDNYEVQIGDSTCKAKLSSGVDASFGTGNTCDFDYAGVTKDLVVKSVNEFTSAVTPGVRTLTVTFKSTTD
ncbi:hypothetical protein OOP60_005132 [Salmonella enterica]|nr:hypothetical protein [Salmonella enterica]EJJ4081687.1 hypothetical protein [Salmonella enterica]EKB5404652.1 hypothetical protein [Salmonella enterica]EKB5476695.1 hypothetical protein [Salmonella enterica]EKC2616459.1 hypothetical protein [Salmonella enterica]